MVIIIITPPASMSMMGIRSLIRSVTHSSWGAWFQPCLLIWCLNSANLNKFNHLYKGGWRVRSFIQRSTYRVVVVASLKLPTYTD